MEDPNRMRTKLRLDLNDIGRQIEDLEDLLDKEKKPEYVEEHRKLIEYEKKLKTQYEKMTGLSIEQATILTGAKRGGKKEVASGFGRFLGLLTGIIYLGGFYNLIGHSLGSINPVFFINYLLGNQNSEIGGMADYQSNLSDQTALYIIYATLGIPIFLSLLRSLLSNSRKEIYSVLQSFALIIPVVYLLYIFAFPEPGDTITEQIFNIAIVFAVSGASIILAGFGTRKFMGKLASFAAGALFFLAAYQAYLTSIDPNLIAWDQIIYNGPFFYLPVMLVGLTISISYLLGFLED